MPSIRKTGKGYTPRAEDWKKQFCPKCTFFLEVVTNQAPAVCDLCWEQDENIPVPPSEL